MDNIVDTKFEPSSEKYTHADKIDIFKNVLEPLHCNGWQLIKTQSNQIIMNKKYHELEEIVIEYKNSHYHFSLPIKDSIFSYYKKIPDELQSVLFFKSYVDYLV